MSIRSEIRTWPTAADYRDHVSTPLVSDVVPPPNQLTDALWADVCSPFQHQAADIDHPIYLFVDGCRLFRE